MSFSPTTLTALQRAQVSANIEVPAEPVGALDGMNLKFDDKGAALGQVVVVPVVVPSASSQATPAATPSSGSSQTPVNMQVTITNVPEQSMVFTGEDLRLLETMDSRDEILKQWLAQAERAHRNEMSAAAGVALSIAGSRAVGKAGSIPFQTDMTGLTAARKILRQNGAPMADVQVVASIDGYANLLNQNVIQKANEAGSDQERRSGIIRSQFGFNSIREDAQITDHTAGTGTAFLVAHPTAGTYAVKTTAIAVDTGSAGTILIGDVITFAGDPNQYVVVPAPGTSTSKQTLTDSNVTGSGTIHIGNPGLRVPLADETAITVVSATTQNGVVGYSPSFVFERHAAVGIIRPPIQPSPAIYYSTLDTVTDKFGYTYLFAESHQVFQVSWYLWVAYGFAITQSEYVVPIIGN